MDYTRNEDKWTYKSPGDNFIFDVVDLEESGTNEPVTIQECKDYMRLEGWAGEESLATEFSFDDDFIGELRTTARQFVEREACVSLVPHVFEVHLTNGSWIELPYSPIVEITGIVDRNGDDVLTDNIKTVGGSRKYLTSPIGEDMIVTYTTSALKDNRPLTDIKRIVAALYENRGMSVDEVLNSLVLLLPSYSRKPFVA